MVQRNIYTGRLITLISIGLTHICDLIIHIYTTDILSLSPNIIQMQVPLCTHEKGKVYCGIFRDSIYLVKVL
jgi:hypothetical protein